MRIFLVLFILVCFSVSGCAVFEVDSLRTRVSNLEKRVDSVEGEDYGVEETIRIEEAPTTFVKEAPVRRSVAESSRISLSNREVQIALRNAGYYDGPIDGKIGPKTKKAIREFQADNGLKVDGVVGIQTKAELVSYLPMK